MAEGSVKHNTPEENSESVMKDENGENEDAELACVKEDRSKRD